MDNNSLQVRKDEAKMRMSSLGAKALLWFIVLMVTGTIVCIILSVLKVAVQAIITLSAVLAVIVVIGVAVYYAISYKYHADRYRRALRDAQRNR